MIQPVTIKNNPSVFSSHDFAAVVVNSLSGEKSLVSLSNFKMGDVLTIFFAGNTFNVPNYLTIQIDTNTHISLSPEFLQYTNHSCNPNVFFDTNSMQLIALKEISANDHLCFFYPSTELDMARPFECKCGSNNCLNTIRGALHVPMDLLLQYKLTDFIQGEIGKKSIP